MAPAEAIPPADRLLAGLAAITAAHDFVDLVERDPELLTDDVLSAFHSMAKAPGYGPLMAPIASLLEEAREDPVAAFARYREFRGALDKQMESVGEAVDQVELLLATSAW